MDHSLLKHLVLASLQSMMGTDHAFLNTLYKVCLNKAIKLNMDKGYQIHLICVEELKKFHNLKLMKRMREIRNA